MLLLLLVEGERRTAIAAVVCKLLGLCGAVAEEKGRREDCSCLKLSLLLRFRAAAALLIGEKEVEEEAVLRQENKVL